MRLPPLALVPPATLALAVLAFVPAWGSPFHAPKTLILAVGALVALPGLTRERLVSTRALPLMAVLVSWALGDAWLPMPLGTQLAFALAVLTWRARAEQVELAAALSGGLCALVALAQAAGVDPFGAWLPDSPGRLAVYGTVGNPDFVASVLGVCGLLSVGLARRVRGAWLLVGLHLAGLAATRSMASLLVLAAGGVVLVWLERSWRTALGVILAGALVVGLVVHRDARRAVDGRLYLHRVAAPHVLDAPLFGRGPGAVEALWPVWEAQWWAARCPDAECVAQHPDRQFAELQDHVHDDWLERLLEGGGAGLAALLVVLARRRAPPHQAALASVLARAVVDFPLARPADLALVAAVLACADTSSSLADGKDVPRSTPLERAASDTPG